MVPRSVPIFIRRQGWRAFQEKLSRYLRNCRKIDTHTVDILPTTKIKRTSNTFLIAFSLSKPHALWGFTLNPDYMAVALTMSLLHLLCLSTHPWAVQEIHVIICSHILVQTAAPRTGIIESFHHTYCSIIHSGTYLTWGRLLNLTNTPTQYRFYFCDRRKLLSSSSGSIYKREFNSKVQILYDKPLLYSPLKIMTLLKHAASYCKYF